MFRSTCDLCFPKMRTGYCSQLTLLRNLFLFAVALSSIRTIGQEAHIVPRTGSAFAEDKANKSAPTRDGNKLRVNVIYAISIYDRYFATIEEQVGPALLSEVSEETGGRMFTVDNPRDLADIATKIGAELRNQYILGYRPVNGIYDGKWRKIKVKLSLPKGFPRCEAHAKQGYYALSQ